MTLSYKITGIERSLRIGQAQEEQETIEAVNVLSFSNYRNYQKINPYLNDLHLKMTKVLSIWIALPIF